MYRSHYGLGRDRRDHRRRGGLTVTAGATRDRAATSREIGLAGDGQAYNLPTSGTYAVSGHVPAGVVGRVLGERPDIKALTLPGMPRGSPGMGGAGEASTIAMAKE
ncbi:MAG: DUF411 domain-containing protein [Nitratireductor sp.]